MPEDVAVILHQTVEARRSAVDQMMWQVPALNLTAQSFLLSVALSSSPAPEARLLAAALALVAALAAIQLMLKHRFYELQLSEWLERLGVQYRWPSTHSPEKFSTYAWGERDHPWRDDAKATGIWRSLRRAVVKRSSLDVWVWALGTFAAADTMSLVAAALKLL